MRRFRFRLQGLLRLRTQLEQSARRSVATAMGAVAGIEGRLSVADEGMRQCEQLGCSTAAHAPLARALAQGLSRHCLQLQNQLRAAEAQLDRARTDWLERRREHKTLTLLRDKKREEWLREQMASEQRELEELSRRRPASTAPQEEGK